MIKHIYLIKLKDRTSIKNVVSKLKTLKNHVPELVGFEVEEDFKGSETSYDIVEYCEFKTRADFESFGKNEYHQQLRNYLKSVQQSVAKVDIETKDEVE